MSAAEEKSRPYPDAADTASLLSSGGTAARLCTEVIEHFGLETPVDVLTAADDEEVRMFLQEKENTPIASAWPWLVRWARNVEATHKKRILKMAQDGATTPSLGGAPEAPPAKVAKPTSTTRPPPPRLAPSKRKVPWGLASRRHR